MKKKFREVLYKEKKYQILENLEFNEEAIALVT